MEDIGLTSKKTLSGLRWQGLNEVKTPQSTVDLARRIVDSWAGPSNRVIISAPVTNQLLLFDLLRNPERVMTQGGQNRFRVAYVDSAECDSESTFLASILTSWNVNAPNSPQIGLRNAIKNATKHVFDAGAIPVLLVPSFHDAIQKLSYDVGACLREVEFELELRTVVALPISYQRYRERLRLELGPGVNFLHSEFAAEHPKEVLRGYTKDEVRQILKEEDIEENCFTVVWELTGGLPRLVALLTVAARRMAPDQLKEYARTQAHGWCERFLRWIDHPGHNIFKRLITERLCGVTIRQSDARLSDHDWAELIIDRTGALRSKILGWACADAYWRQDSTGLSKVLEEQLTRRDAQSIANFVGTIEATSRKMPEFEASEIIAEFQLRADPNAAEWHMAEAALDRALRMTEGDKANTYLSMLAPQLLKWVPLTKSLSRFCKAKRGNKNLRAEEFFIGVSGGEPNPNAYLQFLALRLQFASSHKLQPALALQSVLALPENVLQVYCHQKLLLDFWSAKELDQQVYDSVTKYFGAKDYTPIAPGGRMSVNDLLYVGWVMMKMLPEEQRLFSEVQGVWDLKNIYGSPRGNGAHSIDLASAEQWQKYRNFCDSLLKRAAGILVGNSCDLVLPNLLDELISLLQRVKNIGAV